MKKRNRPTLPVHHATVALPTEPDWIDITERLLGCGDGTKVTLISDSKITSDVSSAFARGVRISLDGHKLWVKPALNLALRMSWEVIL